MTRRARAGQGILEVALVLIAVCLGLVAIFPLVNAAVQHRFKSGGDGLGHLMLYPR